MAKDVYSTHIDLGTNPVHEVCAIRENTTQHAAKTQYGLYHVSSDGALRLGTIWKDPSQELRSEWLAIGTEEKAPTYNPTLSAAMLLLGRRTLPAALEA